MYFAMKLYLGGCTTGLFITDPEFPDVRYTLDVDCIVDVISLNQYHRVRLFISHWKIYMLKQVRLNIIDLKCERCLVHHECEVADSLNNHIAVGFPIPAN